MTRPTTKLNAIENTAIRLFSAKGIKEVTIRDIANDAGYYEGALYRHYLSKEKMTLTLYKREVEQLGSLLTDILNHNGSFSKRLINAIDLFYSFFDIELEKFKFILLSEYNFPVEFRVNPELNPYNIVFKFVANGISQGAFKVNPILYSAIIQGIVMQPANLMASVRYQGTMKEKVKEIVDASNRVLNAK